MSNEILSASPQLGANEMLMAKTVAEKLHSVYPGHLWAVDVQGSVINIRDLLTDGRWGVTLHIPAVYSISSLEKQVVMLGGELLERFNQRRGAYNAEHVLSLPVGVDGHLMPEL